jgi:PIN domain nuclease of toxin-antitoxin system
MSAYLLDTCALVWWMADAPELGRAARRAIGSRRNEILVSAASLWEIANSSTARDASAVWVSTWPDTPSCT